MSITRPSTVSLRLAVSPSLRGAAVAPARRTSRAAHRPAPRPTKLALVGGMLLDGYEAPPIHHAAILIDGERIVKVGPAAEIADSARTTRSSTRAAAR